MNERQKALLAYVMTIGPHVSGAQTLDDFSNRLVRCMREDIVFVFQGFATGFIEMGKRAVEQKIASVTSDVAGMFAAGVGEFFGNMARNSKK